MPPKPLTPNRVPQPLPKPVGAAPVAPVAPTPAPVTKPPEAPAKPPQAAPIAPPEVQVVAPAPVVVVRQPVPVAPPVVLVAPTPVRVETFWLVTDTCRVPRRGGAEYVLPKGKVLSSTSYDIDDLKAMGVPLEAVASRQTLLKATIIGKA